MTHWTRESIDRELDAIDGGGIAYGRGGKGSEDISARNFLSTVAVRDLLAERDKLAAELETRPKPTAPTYRLPDWLGGREVEIVDEMVGWGFPAVTVQAYGEVREPMVVARAWLVEVPAACTCPDHMRDHR